MVDGIGWVATIVGVNVSRFGPGFPLEMGGGEGIEVILCGVGKKRPGVFGIEKIE